MDRTRVALVAWALVATLILALVIAWPEAPGMRQDRLQQALTARPAQAQTEAAPAQLEWLGWQFFRLTSLTGKVVLFNPALNDPAALFRNRESPLSDINAAHVILVTAGHADDQGMAAEISRKTGAPIVATFELASWPVGRGVEAGKILRGGPGSRFDVEGLKIQVVHAVHGSGAPPLPGQPAAVYGGTALGFIVTLENGVKVYHAGSTALTTDLELYGRLYRRHVALLPIGTGMYPDEAAIAVEMLMTDNPNLHSVFPQHHASFLPAEQQGAAFVRAVQGRRLRRAVTAFDPRPGQVFLVTGIATRPR